MKRSLVGLAQAPPARTRGPRHGRVFVDLEDRNPIAVMDATRIQVVGHYGLSDKNISGSGA